MIDQSTDVTQALNSLSRLLLMSRTIILFMSDFVGGIDVADRTDQTHAKAQLLLHA